MVKSYPILEPVRSADPKRLVKDFKFWQDITPTDQIHEHAEGLICSALELFGDIDRAVQFFSPYFPDFNKENIALAFTATGTIIVVGQIIRKKLSKKPLADFADEDNLIKYLAERVNEPNAAQSFRDDSKFYRNVTGKILGAVADHLSGEPAEAACSLGEVIKKYQMSRRLESYLRIRYGKTLAASGYFDDAESEYDWVSEHSEDIVLQALAYREILNISIQRAWTYYQKTMLQELYGIRTKVKQLIEKIDDRVRSHYIESNTKEKLRVSLSEFRAYNRALDPALALADRQTCLSEVIDSINELTKVDSTTGINRRTQAATLMIRWSEPDRAIHYIQKGFGGYASSLERAAAKIVEGQAQKSLGKRNAAHGAFLDAEKELEETQEIRFWRDARRLRLTVEKSPSPFLRLGLFARRWSAGDRLNGAFIAH